MLGNRFSKCKLDNHLGAHNLIKYADRLSVTKTNFNNQGFNGDYLECQNAWDT